MLIFAGLGIEPSLDLLRRAPEVAEIEIGRDHRHAFLVDTPDLAGPRVDHDVGDGIERYRPVALGIYDEFSDLFYRIAVRFPRPHQDIDLAVVERILCGDLAAHLADDAVGYLVYRETERSGPFAVEADLDLGMSRFHRGFHVGEAG